MSVLLVVLRWCARLSGLLIVGAYTLIVIGDLSNPRSPGPRHWIEWAGIVLMTLACLALLGAWRWELPGALISLAALAVIAVMIRGSTTFHRSLFIMSLPGILYCLDWLAHRRIQNSNFRAN